MFRSLTFGLFILAAVASFATSAKAKTYNTLVQCDEAGPVYSGTLDMPDQRDVVCRDGMVLSIKKPIVLRFNSLSYAIGGDRLFGDAKCSIKSLSANAAVAVEQNTSLQKAFEMDPDSDGYAGQLGHCGFKTQPTN